MPSPSLSPNFSPSYERDHDSAAEGSSNDPVHQNSARADEVFSQPFAATKYEAMKAAKFGEFVYVCFIPEPSTAERVRRCWCVLYHI